jgi:outer membrane protein OmpA-like peptidoglycan-associated protein/predicted flap endonuclease-1-like 5' DNA nuclease
MAPAFDVGVWTILWWIFIGMALAGLLSFLFRGGTTAETVSIANRFVKVEEPMSVTADDLEVIEGIGPDIAALFHGRGVHRFAEVAGMQVADIQAMLEAGGAKFSLARPFTWPFQAMLLTNGQYGAFAQVVSALRGGVVGPKAIDGIGDAMAERMRAVDVASIEMLAKADAADLSAKLSAEGTAVSADRTGGWIEAARRMIAGDIEALLGLFGLERSVLSAWSGRTLSTSTQVVERKLAETLTAAAPVARARDAALPLLLIGLIGAALLALLCFLGIICPKKADVAAPVVAEAPSPTVPTVPAIPTGAGVLAETIDGKPALNVYFDLDKREVAALTDEAAPLKAYLEANPGARLSVSGYVDPRGDAAYNAELAKNRAENVKAALETAGLPGDRIDLDKPADIVGDGSTYSEERKVTVRVKEAGVVDSAVAPALTEAQP